MKTHFLFFAALILMTSVSCGDSKDDEIQILPPTADKKVDLTISTDFNDNAFTSQVERELLKELQICNAKDGSEEDEKNPACSPKFFRFFKLSEKTPLKDGFVLLVKAGVNDFPLRRVLIFEREGGKLVKLNGFNGNIIERRNSPSGYPDLIIRFADNEDNSLIYYNCLFKWKDGVYAYQYCEEIDEAGPRKVKAEFRDSMGVEIKKILDRNQMIF